MFWGIGVRGVRAASCVVVAPSNGRGPLLSRLCTEVANAPDRELKWSAATLRDVQVGYNLGLPPMKSVTFL